MVALALRDAEGRLLLQRRPDGKHHGGLWEFPGGKVESGENPRDALVREIAEELSIALDPQHLEPAHFAEEHARNRIVLLLYTSHQFAGAIVPEDGQEWGWFNIEDAARLDLAPMDRSLLSRLSD